MSRELWESADLECLLGGTDTPEGRAAVLKGIPLGRIATPEDIGNAACFLATSSRLACTSLNYPRCTEGAPKSRRVHVA